MYSVSDMKAFCLSVPVCVKIGYKTCSLGKFVGNVSVCV